MQEALRRTATIALLALCAASAAAQDAPTVWIASGESGGTYRHVYANNFERQLRGYDVLHRETSGSGENLDLLASGQVDIAFAQADIYAGRLAADPERYADIEIVGRLGEECVYLAYRRDGLVSTLAQLASPVDGRPARIAVGPEKGGMSGTWRYLVSLEPSLANASVLHAGDTLALNQLAIGQYDVVGWVTDPVNLDHKLLRTVRDNADLDLMDIDDPALTKSLPDGTIIYREKKVRVEEGWRGRHIRTLCTNALVFARKDADPRLLGRLADIVALYGTL